MLKHPLFDGMHQTAAGIVATSVTQYSLQVAWVGAAGILDDATAATLPGSLQQQLHMPATARQGAAETPQAAEHAVVWEGSGRAANLSMLAPPTESYLRWRASDRSFGREYVPQIGQPVCMAATGVPPPLTSVLAQPKAQSAPGLYLFTCRRPTAFICECKQQGVALYSFARRCCLPCFQAASLWHTATADDPLDCPPRCQKVAVCMWLWGRGHV